MTMTTSPWHDSHDNVVTLARHLYGIGHITAPDEIIDLFEKPWHYQTEWDELDADNSDPYTEVVYVSAGTTVEECDDLQDQIEATIKEHPNNSLAETLGGWTSDGTSTVTVTCRTSTHEALAATTLVVRPWTEPA